MFVSIDAIYQYTVIYDLVFSHNPIASIWFVAGERMRPKTKMNPHMLGCCDITWQHRDSLAVLLHPPVAQADHTYKTMPQARLTKVPLSTLSKTYPRRIYAFVRRTMTSPFRYDGLLSLAICKAPYRNLPRLRPTVASRITL